MVDRDRDYFSLSNVDMKIAREFIEYILEFMFLWDVPINLKVVILARSQYFLYLCLVHRKFYGMWLVRQTFKTTKI